MTSAADGVTGDTPSPIALCVVRSEAFGHARLYSVIVSLDVMGTSSRRRHRSTNVDEVLRIVADFLRESTV